MALHRSTAILPERVSRGIARNGIGAPPSSAAAAAAARLRRLSGARDGLALARIDRGAETRA
jgi:hypothetical protein